MVASAVVARLKPEEVRELERLVIRALKRWKKDGSINDNESGIVITELVSLLIKHQRLLNAAQLLLSYEPLIANSGHMPRLAHVLNETIKELDWRALPDVEYGYLILHYTLTPFLGEPINKTEQATA